MESIPETAAAKLGGKLSDLLRYGYPGFLVAVMWCVYAPLPAEKLFGKLNLAGTAGAIWLIGYGTFSVYRALFSPLMDFVNETAYRAIQIPTNWLAEKKFNRKWIRNLARACRLKRTKRQLLEVFGVPRASSQEAFAVVRDSFFDESHQSKFYRQHTECHAVYLTGFIVLGTIALSHWFNVRPQVVPENLQGRLELLFWLIGAFALLGGLYQDNRISIRESIYLQSLAADDKIRDALQRLINFS